VDLQLKFQGGRQSKDATVSVGLAPPGWLKSTAHVFGVS